MSSFNYWCPNTSGNCNSRKLVVIQHDANDKEKHFCESCGTVLKLMGENISGGYTKFASLTPEQKRKMLLERSKKHNDKTGITEKRKVIDQRYKQEAKERFGFK